ALHNLFRRTTKVQINQVETKVFDDPRSIGHYPRIASEQLCGDWVLVFIKMQVALRLLVLGPEHAISRRELGHDQPAPAKVPNESPEDGIRYPSHRRQHRRRRDRNRADLNRRWHSRGAWP